MNFKALETLATSLVARARFANVAGKTFGGDRDLYEALGYARVLNPADYRARFKRNAIAGRVVESKPEDTWRGGAELIEDDDVTTDTPFETAFEELNQRLKIWPTFKRADTLAGIGHYSIILLVAPGALDTPLESCTPEALVQLSIFAEEDATVAEWDIDANSARFGLPIFYNVKRTSMTSRTSINSSNIAKKVHYSRVQHIADGLLDDRVFGTPRLERIWNLIDDLEKVTGGGAEAFWKRADQGTQFDLDPTVNLEPAEIAALEAEVDEYNHGLKRILRTRGMKINSLGSDVANFSGSVDSIIAQISAGTGIPQRVLMGSEQGRMAADQDSVKYYRMIESRRADFADPQVVRPFIDRLIELGVLPEPPKGYDIRWSQIKTMDDDEKATLAGKWVALNQGGNIVVLPNEIREQCLGLEPLTSEELDSPTTDEDVVVAERVMRAAMAEWHEPEASAQPINITVQMPRTGNKKVIRDAHGVVVGLEHEETPS